MVLAAGLGTRLRPLTDLRAKPLVPIGDRPALLHVLERLARAGLAPRAVNVHHRAEDVADAAARAGALVSREDELLGTAGGVARALPLLGAGDVLVWNGDIVADVDPAALVRAHRAAATLLVRGLPAGEGNVGVAADGAVVRLRGETCAPGEASGGEFLAIHVLGAQLARSLPARGCLVGDAYLPALRRGARIEAVLTRAAFRDVGTIASYVAANVDWLASRGLGAWRADGAIVDPRVELRDSVVGAGARVEGAGALERVVVWPGAVARAPLRDAVVTEAGAVPIPPRATTT